MPIEMLADKIFVNNLRCRFLNFKEIEESLYSIVNSVSHAFPKIHAIIFTLSPIPLKHTGSKIPVQSANLFSKSLLAAAISRLITQDTHHGLPSIHYFPSYEIVTEAAQHFSNVWQEDQRHVTPDIIGAVCSLFLEWLGIESTIPTNFSVPLVNASGEIVGSYSLSHEKVKNFRSQFSIPNSHPPQPKIDNP